MPHILECFFFYHIHLRSNLLNTDCMSLDDSFFFFFIIIFAKHLYAMKMSVSFKICYIFMCLSLCLPIFYPENCCRIIAIFDACTCYSMQRNPNEKLTKFRNRKLDCCCCFSIFIQIDLILFFFSRFSFIIFGVIVSAKQ